MSGRYEEPLHLSPGSATSLWQECRVYPSRVELQCHTLFTTMVIPAHDIERIEVVPGGWADDLGRLCCGQ